MFYNKKIWIILTIVGLLFAFGAYKIFPKTFPILSIKLDMSRESALLESKALSNKFNLGPEDHFQVATFGVDGYTQNYIELDAGGSSEFIKILDKKYYEAYTWKVRHYKPNEVNEVWFKFTPEGDVYGFYEKISDDLFLESLSISGAQNLAELESSKYWNVDLSNYNLVESKEDLKVSGRSDYTFVYKRSDISIGDEGEYRLSLTVSGNKLTEVKYFIKIPETFNRKYEEMRSFNNTIASLSTYGMFIFYVFGGIIVGLFILNRERWLLWKTAIYWALFVSVLTLVSGLNYLSLSWLGYDTAISSQNFIIQNITMSFIGAIADFVLILLSFVAAESLTRKAFPNHIKFWNLWKGKNPVSYEVIGQTLGGYLLIGLDLIFVVVFYMITANYFGWWVPSSTLFSPDMIATPFPWLSAVGMSLHAGFWEECLFRAIPIAGAVLISKKYGNRTLWIVFAMILQAVIFAGAHANYPSYPSYSRLVELIIPSLFWGFIYIRFGLLPVIISHFGYDVVWFSLPLFASSSIDLIFDKIMVIVLTLIPVWVILKSWLKYKEVKKIDNSELNNSFIPQEVIEKEVSQKSSINEFSINKNYKVVLYVLFILGMFSYSQYISNIDYSSLSLKVSRKEALNLSDKYLNDNSIELDDDWSVLSEFIPGNIDASDRFIWQRMGQEIYQDLLGQYLSNNLWNIRYVKFSGDLNEKAEEYSVIINPDGSFNQIRHKIPENRAGESLSENEARLIAQEYINEKLNINNEFIEEISFQPSDLPNRKDWSFVFSDKSYLLNEGDLRININISGDEIVSHSRFVYIPEEWERNDQNNTSLIGIVGMICSVLLTFLILFAAASSIAQWSKGLFSFRLFKNIFILLSIFGILDIFNSYPALVSVFSTAQPFFNQISTSLISSLLYVLMASFSFSVIISAISVSKPESDYDFSYFEIVLISFIIIGFSARVFFVDSLMPTWIEGLGIVNSYVSIFKAINGEVFSYFLTTSVLLFIINLLNKFKNLNNVKRIFYVSFVCLLFSFLFIGVFVGGNVGINSISSWIYSTAWASAIFIILYLNYFIYNIAMIPLVIAFIKIFSLLGMSFSDSYPDLFIINIVCSIILLFIGYFMHFKLINSKGG